MIEKNKKKKVEGILDKKKGVNIAIAVAKKDIILHRRVT